MDAKKSPLALLAQTCSQIGADPPVVPSSHKSSLLSGTSSSNNNNHETHSSLSTTKSKSSGTSGSHPKSSHQQDPHRKLRSTSSSPQAEKVLKRTHQVQSEPGESPSIPISPSSGIASSSGGATPVITSTTGSRNPGSAPTLSDSDKSTHHQRDQSKTPSNGSSSKASTPNLGNTSPTSASSSLNPNNKSPPTSTHPLTGPLHAMPLPTTSSTSTTPTTSNKLNLSGPTSFNFNMNSSFDLALKHGLAFSGLYPSPASSGTGIPPYLHSYARLKNAAGNNGTTLDALSTAACRDPFCTGCHLGPHFSGVKGACPSGCIQCDHHKGPLPIGPPFGLPFLSGLPIPPSLAGLYASASHGYASHQSLHSSQPYVCNWFVGESYCGKRFSTSDELLQHLRSHTTLSSGNGAGHEGSASQSLAAAALAAGYPPPSFLTSTNSHNHPLLGGPHGLLSRTYPTPPLSPLNSARFHPYSKSGSSGVNASSLSSLSSPASSFFQPGFPLGHPAFSPYYPYLYGQRFGASSGSLHP